MNRRPVRVARNTPAARITPAPGTKDRPQGGTYGRPIRRYWSGLKAIHNPNRAPKRASATTNQGKREVSSRSLAADYTRNSPHANVYAAVFDSASTSSATRSDTSNNRIVTPAKFQISAEPSRLEAVRY